MLPIVLDVGTNNKALREHPLYLGLNRTRLEGAEYYAFMDEFVTAVTQRYPKAVLQFEDFSIDKALPLLDRYRYDHLVFNDDIQARRRRRQPRLCALAPHIISFATWQLLPNTAQISCIVSQLHCTADVSTHSRRLPQS